MSCGPGVWQRRISFSDTSKWTADEIAGLFRSSSWPARGYPWHAEMAARAISDGLISVTQEHIAEPPPLAEDLPLFNRERVAYFSAFACGGEWHSIAKYWAWHWLRDQGEPDPYYESLYRDVWAPVLKIQVECGDTDPLKVIRALAGGAAAFVLFPMAARWPVDVWLYVFRPTSPHLHTRGLDEYLTGA